MVRQISIRCCANYAFFLSGQCLIVLIDPHFDFKSAWLIHLGVSENLVPLFPKDYHVSYFFHIKIFGVIASFNTLILGFTPKK